MADINYDPYSQTQQPTIGQTAKETVMAGLRPSNYIGMYFNNPFFYSGRKGIYVPFVGKRIEDALGQEHAWEAFSKGISNDVKTWARETYTKGWKKGVTGTLGTLKKGVVNVFTFGATSKNSGMVGERWLNKTREHYSRVVNKQDYKNAMNMVELDYMKTPGNTKLKWQFQKIATGFKIRNEIGVFTKTDKLVSPKIQSLAKWGLRGAKVATGVGAALFAWDMVKAVGAPLGQAMMKQLNSVALEYQNRFMPETGGKLQASYLSQGAATERQRAIQAISKAYINGRSALGSEANYY